MADLRHNSNSSEPSAGGPNNFDADGNLNKMGQMQMGYLKAKCLYKMKRYSESLF